MTGSEIARELGVSRQAVSQILKKAIDKVYKGLMNENITESPLQTVMFMRDWFGVEAKEDIKQFIDLLPREVYKEVKLDMQKMLGMKHGVCRKCVHFVQDGGTVYCEHDKFPDVMYNKTKLYYSTDFDCENFDDDTGDNK